MLLVLAVRGAYRPRLSMDIFDEVRLIVGAATITLATIVVVQEMLHQFEYSRGVIVYLWILVIVSLTVGRGLFRSVQTLCYRRGVGVRRLLVVGATDAGRMVMQSVAGRRDLGYHLVGFVDHRDLADPRDFGRFRALGTLVDVPNLIEDGLVEEIIVALPASAHEEVWPILTLCERHGVGLKLVPDLYEMSLSRVQVDDIGGIPLLDVREPPSRRLARLVKRFVDVVVAAVITVVSLPLLALLALAIRLESPGAPLLRQKRVGLNGRIFTCFKFRTMRPDAEAVLPTLAPLNETEGLTFKMRQDPRCTPLGRRIRRWSLDELPQIWNVLLGDMSLVGPRPPLPAEVASYEARHMRRLEVKPGMTGIWQVSGRSNLSFDEMVMMDIFYVDNWSPTLDLRILVRTVIAVLRRHGAY
jgi:exopolysaccharide biosynthesis polyprenyl glycosylphosphotransferase